MISIRHGGHYYLICHGPNTRKLCDPLLVWPSSHMCVMHPITITFSDPGLCRAQPTPNATFTPSWLLARGSWLPMSPLSMTGPAITMAKPIPLRLLDVQSAEILEHLPPGDLRAAV